MNWRKVLKVLKLKKRKTKRKRCHYCKKLFELKEKGEWGYCARRFFCSMKCLFLFLIGQRFLDEYWIPVDFSNVTYTIKEP